MSIWRSTVDPGSEQEHCRGTMIEHLGIRFTAYGDDWLEGTMPVNERTIQPFGLLHGGASVVLAETLGSHAANLCLDRSRYSAVGQEINANHLRAVRSGIVTGRASPIHLGLRSQVWSIEIRDERGRLTCISRLTMSVVDAPAGGMLGKPAA
jgi:1,4-dihydroxy-2-naphthoyl-CoA hydrolase